MKGDIGYQKKSSESVESIIEIGYFWWKENVEGDY